MERAKEIYMYVLGALVVVSGFVLVWLLIFQAVPTSNERILDVGLGILLGQVTTVIGYFYGSSKSSADKTNLIANGRKE